MSSAYLGFFEAAVFLQLFLMCHIQVPLLLLEPLRTHWSMVQVLFVPSKVRCPGSNPVFLGLSQWNCLLVGSREKHSKDASGGGGFLLSSQGLLGE